MKIIYISNARLPTEKAHGYQIMKMCEAFALNGLKVTLIHPYRKQPDNKLAVCPFDYYDVERLFQIKTLQGTDYIDFFNQKLPKLEVLGFKIQSILHGLKIVLITLPYWKSSDVVLFSRDLTSVLILLLFRPFIKAQIVFEAHSITGKSIKYVMRLLNRLDLLVTISESLKDIFIKQGIAYNKTLVSHDAVDIKKFGVKLDKYDARKQVGIRTEGILATYVGKFHTLGMEKGIQQIIRASKYILDNYPQLFFYFIGGPIDNLTVYEELISIENLPSERFIFLDKQPIEKVPLFLQASDLLLMPFPWTQHFAYFMSPLKMFEYMASRRPIVASKLPTIQEVLNSRNSSLCEPDNIESLALCMRELLDNPIKGESLAGQAFLDVQKYTWVERARSIIQALKIKQDRTG